MGRKCFISHKREDKEYKRIIQEELDIDMVDKSLDELIDSDNEEYIMQCIRRDYLSDSTVTIHLIGAHSAENLGREEQKYIKRELQASLYNSESNRKNGILGVVLPSMYDTIYLGKYYCMTCRNYHNHVSVNNSTTIREFNYNYYIPGDGNKCSWSEEDRYCVLVRWDEFEKAPEKYIEEAFNKREAPISKRTKVYPE